MNNSEKLRAIIENCGSIGEKVLDQQAEGGQYRLELLKLLDLMRTIEPDEIRAAGFPGNIQNTLLMDRHLIDDTVTNEVDQLSLLSTAVTYVACNSEGRPGHSAAYMDRVTALRKVLEKEYNEEAIRFCGSDGC